MEESAAVARVPEDVLVLSGIGEGALGARGYEQENISVLVSDRGHF